MALIVWDHCSCVCVCVCVCVLKRRQIRCGLCVLSMLSHACHHMYIVLLQHASLMLQVLTVSQTLENAASLD